MDPTGKILDPCLVFQKSSGCNLMDPAAHPRIVKFREEWGKCTNRQRLRYVRNILRRDMPYDFRRDWKWVQEALKRKIRSDRRADERSLRDFSKSRTKKPWQTRPRLMTRKRLRFMNSRLRRMGGILGFLGGYIAKAGALLSTVRFWPDTHL